MAKEVGSAFFREFCLAVCLYNQSHYYKRIADAEDKLAVIKETFKIDICKDCNSPFRSNNTNVTCESCGTLSCCNIVACAICFGNMILMSHLFLVMMK